MRDLARNGVTAAGIKWLAKGNWKSMTSLTLSTFPSYETTTTSATRVSELSPELIGKT